MSDVGFRVQDLGFRVWSYMFWNEISSAGRPPGRHCKTQKTLEKRSESQHLRAAPPSWPYNYIMYISLSAPSPSFSLYFSPANSTLSATSLPLSLSLPLHSWKFNLSFLVWDDAVFQWETRGTALVLGSFVLKRRLRHGETAQGGSSLGMSANGMGCRCCYVAVNWTGCVWQPAAWRSSLFASFSAI